ncbi:citrate lyase holo-[acyl-carrier protein] synthase [Isobaculum melis]|uniref:citrate lyase holo-[acyl-carrier protein] synthase n=1 Tax=Isobaculum melis TaxID=142588 RepID=A0A1H9TLL8_9LACT|nr:citrate lyase holo-[acyl-carrier protein] synthase [Isobaculum melis]SER97809.1 holo-ACP synthase [Isobaculum melis]
MDLFAGGNPISLQDMLDVREKRALFQQEKLYLYQLPMLSFQCNIPGPIKMSPMIEQVFQMGVAQIMHEVGGYPILGEWVWSLATGPEYFVVIDCAPQHLKKICVQIEAQGLGRLFDMDVLMLNSEGKQQAVSRTEIGYPERTCFVCGQPAKQCGRSRKHGLEEMTEVLNQLVIDKFNTSF